MLIGVLIVNSILTLVAKYNYIYRCVKIENFGNNGIFCFDKCLHQKTQI
jgi:hypothetical protein